MPRIKTSKEFAIKLIHPQFGDFYFSYAGWNSGQYQYVFVQNLSKVTKWKTTKFTEKQINLIISNLKQKKGRIMISFGSIIDESLKLIMIESKRKYYLPVTLLKTKIELNKATDSVNKNNFMFKENSKNFLDSFKNIQNDLIFKLNDYILDGDASMENIDIDKYTSDVDQFLKNTKNLSKNIKNYISDKKIIEEAKKYDGVYLDIVDASYNFRGLKLKTLKAID